VLPAPASAPNAWRVATTIIRSNCSSAASRRGWTPTRYGAKGDRHDERGVSDQPIIGISGDRRGEPTGPKHPGQSQYSRGTRVARVGEHRLLLADQDEAHSAAGAGR
jgi:hypothetical protein